MADYEFVPTSTNEILSELIKKYEAITQRTLNPADPERLFLSWVASIVVQERVNINYVGNQNIPSRAIGDNLDALGETIFGLKRKEAQNAVCTVEFTLSTTSHPTVYIPRGTRVTDTSKSVEWETVNELVISNGEDTGSVGVICSVAGTIGNGYVEGQINTLIDVDNVQYFSSVANTTSSAGGSAIEDDETYREQLRRFLDSYSTAGAKGAYEYYAKSVDDNIADVKVTRKQSETATVTFPVITDDDSKIVKIGIDHFHNESLAVYDGNGDVATVETDYTIEHEDGILQIEIVPDGALDGLEEVDVQLTYDRLGEVAIYALMNDGTPATAETKAAILAACNSDDVRPLTDFVTVEDPEQVLYSVNVEFWRYSSSGESSSEMQNKVFNAVKEYTKWQSAVMGRDINPAKLYEFVMKTGVKRCVVNSPVYTVLRNDGQPQYAKTGVPGHTIVVEGHGGAEDE